MTWRFLNSLILIFLLFSCNQVYKNEKTKTLQPETDKTKEEEIQKLRKKKDKKDIDINNSKFQEDKTRNEIEQLNLKKNDKNKDQLELLRLETEKNKKELELKKLEEQRKKEAEKRRLEQDNRTQQFQIDYDSLDVPEFKKFEVKSKEQQDLVSRAKEVIYDILNPVGTVKTQTGKEYSKYNYKLTIVTGDPGLGKTYISKLAKAYLESKNKKVSFTDQSSTLITNMRSNRATDYDFFIWDDAKFDLDNPWNTEKNEILKSLFHDTSLNPQQLPVWISSNCPDFTKYMKKTIKEIDAFLENPHSKIIENIKEAFKDKGKEIIKEMVDIELDKARVVKEVFMKLINSKNNNDQRTYKFIELKGSSFRKGLVNIFDGQDKKFNINELKEIIKKTKNKESKDLGGIIFVPDNDEIKKLEDQLIKQGELRPLSEDSSQSKEFEYSDVLPSYHLEYQKVKMPKLINIMNLKEDIDGFSKSVKYFYDNQKLLMVKVPKVNKKSIIETFKNKTNKELLIEDFKNEDINFYKSGKFKEIINKYSNKNADKPGLIFVPKNVHKQIILYLEQQEYKIKDFAFNSQDYRLYYITFGKEMNEKSIDKYIPEIFNQNGLIVVGIDIQPEELLQKAEEKYQAKPGEPRSFKAGFIDRLKKSVLFRYK